MYKVAYQNIMGKLNIRIWTMKLVFTIINYVRTLILYSVNIKSYIPVLQSTKYVLTKAIVYTKMARCAYMTTHMYM